MFNDQTIDVLSRGVCRSVFIMCQYKSLQVVFSIDVFLLFISIMFPLGIFFGISVYWFNWFFHKVCMHDLICSTFKKDVFNWYFGIMLSDLEINIYYLKYLLIEICLSFVNLYHIGIDHWLLYACLTIKIH